MTFLSEASRKANTERKAVLSEDIAAEKGVHRYELDVLYWNRATHA